MFWRNGKRTFADSGIFCGFTDCHCHILPGVDDGVETMEESLAILSQYEQLGICNVWLTPHIMEDVPNTTAALKQRFTELKEAYSGSITLHLSAENMLDSVFRERFHDGDLLPWGNGGDRLLAETSYYEPPANFRHVLKEIKSRGFFPVLAHPERYLYMKPSDYETLKKQGVELQLNLFSLIGMYGRRAKDKAEFILNEGLYDYAATDLHAIGTLQSAMQEKLSTKIIAKVLQIGKQHL
jgi:protein-tyrosine phosphatase